MEVDFTLPSERVIRELKQNHFVARKVESDSVRQRS